MTTKDPSRFVLLSKALVRRAGLCLLLAVAGGSAVAGCGNSSGNSDGQPFPEFEGVWAVDDNGDTSTLSCPGEVDLSDGVPFPIVNSILTIEAGVLTDLIETDSPCRFNYEVKGKIATMPDPDPYTGMAPTCQLSISNTDDSNVVLTPNDSPMWTFKLLAPVTGQAPKAQIVGTAAAIVTEADMNGNLQPPLSPCVFVAQIDLHKIAKP